MHFTYLKGREGKREKDVPSASSPFGCLQQAGMGQAGARSTGLHPGLLYGWQGSHHLSHYLLPLRVAGS